MDSNNTKAPEIQRRPHWLKARLPSGQQYTHLRSIIDTYKLHTVCEEARCPNMGECWNAGTATFMILGNVCTRSCTFCAVKTGRPTQLDNDEPRRVAETIKLMGIKHAVITSVNRDELEDGGARIFAETVRLSHELMPTLKIEVLIPDFQGDEEALNIVLDAKPDILNHNIETIPRLYPEVRPQAKYERSLQLLDRARRYGATTKSGVMVGLGEKFDEVVGVMKDLRNVDCDIITIGQYLQPTKDHHPILRYVPPEEFLRFREIGYSMGFRHVESGPLVRSSYHAEQQAESHVGNIPSENS
jgi:lipoic acid synthetase